MTILLAISSGCFRVINVLDWDTVDHDHSIKYAVQVPIDLG